MYNESGWWLTEYAEDIYESLREMEANRTHFDFKSPQLEWRSNCIEIIQDVVKRFDLSVITKHLAVYMLDIFMDSHRIELWRLHLVAITSVWLAAKVDEITCMIPSIQHLNTALKYSSADYRALERMMIKMFDWELNIPTTATFCLYFVEFIVEEDDFERNKQKYRSLKEMKHVLRTMTLSLLDKSLSDCSLQHEIVPSKLAAICLAGARHKQFIEPMWTEKLAQITKYKLSDLQLELQKLLTMNVIPQESKVVNMEINSP